MSARSARSAFSRKQTSKRVRCRRTHVSFWPRSQSAPGSAPARSSRRCGLHRPPPSGSTDSITAIDGAEGPEGRILALLEGSDALVERATLELRSALGRAGVPETRIVEAGAREAFERVVDSYIATLGERSVTYRIHPAPAESLQCALRAQESARSVELRAEAILDLMNADVVLRVSDLDPHSFGAKIDGFDEELHRTTPRAMVVAGEHPRRASLQVWGADPPAIDRMRALKARFDPNRTLNPGRFVGRI